MGKEETRAKSWNTFRETMLQRAKDDPDFNLVEFITQRVDTSYSSWRQARKLERERDYGGARGFYLKAVESLEQAEKVYEPLAATPYLEMLKTEYFNFTVHRDPLYRLTLKYPLVWIKENPGVLQAELYKEFPEIKREDMTYALYFAEKERLIRREKKGRSYQLFFIREKDRNEPFLELEDDEADIQEKEERAKREEQEKAKQEEMARGGCRIALVGLVWLVVAGLAFTFAGPVGIVIAIVAFILWRIVEKNRLKKQSSAKAPVSPPEATVLISSQSESPDRVNENNRIDIQENQENIKQQERKKKIGKIALSFLVLSLWIDALILAIIYTGPVGVGIIIAAFIVWRIIKRNRVKKQKAAEAAASGGAVTPPTIPENQDQNEEREKTLV